MSIEDPIVNEVREAREKIAKECDYNFNKIYQLFADGDKLEQTIKKTPSLKQKPKRIK